MKYTSYASVFALTLCAAFVPIPTSAYAGLGPLIPMIGNGLLLLFVFGLTAIGALAYPIKMLLSRQSSKKKKKTSSTSAT